jgi:hypothetical protein
MRMGLKFLGINYDQLIDAYELRLSRECIERYPTLKERAAYLVNCYFKLNSVLDVSMKVSSYLEEFASQLFTDYLALEYDPLNFDSLNQAINNFNSLLSPSLKSIKHDIESLMADESLVEQVKAKVIGRLKCCYEKVKGDADECYAKENLDTLVPECIFKEQINNFYV